MKKKIVIPFVLCVFISMLAGGCDALRLAPDEVQKQNAYLHNKTIEAAAYLAADENSSEDLQKLTSLGAKQSRAFVSYYGLPDEMPMAGSVGELLSETNSVIADNAIISAKREVDYWDVANSAMDIGIAIAGLFGGAVGIKIASALQTARAKSTALKEIIQGNEIFKQARPDAVSDFKTAQAIQSPATKALVVSQKKVC